MQSDRVAYRGQPIALLVADSLETATEAAGLVRAEYAEEPFSVTLDAPGGETVRQSDTVPLPAFVDKTIGDADTALGTADVVVDAEYVCPRIHPEHRGAPLRRQPAAGN
jgi:xanthine dehydrogenase YagR molybdenum-binding subunit